MSYIRLGLMIGALLACIGCFFFGQHVGKDECQASYAKAKEKADDKHSVVIGAAQQVDQKAAQQEVTRQDTVREIDHETVKTILGSPVYLNSCIDDSGVQLLRRAVGAANGGSSIVGTPDNAAALLSASGVGQPANGQN